MGIAVVQATGQTATSAGAKSKAYASNVTAGNLLVVCASGYDETSNTLANDIADTRGNTWILVGEALSDIVLSSMWYAIAKDSGACTVTVTPDQGDSFTNLAIAEFSGIDTANPLDADAHAEYSGTNVTLAITTIAANTVIVGFFNHGAGTTTITPGHTEIWENQSGSYIVGAAQYEIVASAGLTSSHWTSNVNTKHAVIVASFKMAAAGGLSIPVAMNTYKQMRSV